MELKINIPEGHEIDKEKSTFKKIVFKKIEVELPVRVSDICSQKDFYYFINSGGEVVEIKSSLRDKNDLSSKERAEAFLALMQLLELRDAWNGDSERHPEAIVFSTQRNQIIKVWNGQNYNTLSFKSEKLRDQFYEQFKDLIETAKELL